MKNVSLESKVALRLVSYAERNRTQAELRALAREIGSTFANVMLAVESLAKQQVITFKPVTANLFDFQVEPANRKELCLDASNYERHLQTLAHKGPPRPSVPPPPHLTPITEEQRAPWMAKALDVATRLNSPKIAKKIANCVARIGETEVTALLNRALEQSAATTPPKSAVRIFFEIYTKRRNELIPAPPLLSAIPLTPPP